MKVPAARVKYVRSLKTATRFAKYLLIMGNA